jgi:CRP-like cAMP-binding protein
LTTVAGSRAEIVDPIIGAHLLDHQDAEAARGPSKRKSTETFAGFCLRHIALGDETADGSPIEIKQRVEPGMARQDPKRRIPCTRCPLRKLPKLRDFSDDELAFVDKLKQGELTVEPGGPIVQEGANSPHLYTVLEGWAFRYNTLPDGRRQILNFCMPGDLIGLQTSVFEVMDHGVEALTDMLLCVFPRDKMWSLYTKHPSLGFDMTWLAAREERLLDAHLLTVGRRTALERVAYAILHLFSRARDVGLAKGDSFDIPLSQQHLADTLGLSLVHTNRTLKRLRATGCIEWLDRVIRMKDEDRLRAIAKADVAVSERRPFL